MKLLKLCALGLMLGVFSLSSAYAADFTADKHSANPAMAPIRRSRPLT